MKLNKTRFKWVMRAALLLLIAAAIWIISANGAKWVAQINGFSWTFNWFYICSSAILLGISYFLIPAGWILLSHSAGSQVDTKHLRGAWFMSQLGRYVPGKIWLFAGRAAFLKSQGLTGFRATSVPFLELIYTAAGAGLTAIIPAIFLRSTLLSISALRYAVLAAGISLLLIPFLTPIVKLLYRLKHGRAPSRIPLPGLAGSVKLLLIYSGLWWFRGFILFLWLKGFGISDIDLLVCCAASPLSWLAGYIVFLIPGGIGVREAAVVALVAPAGAAGPVLAVVAGQRLILSIIEVFFALISTRELKVFGERTTM
jgi:glycosyltransferase 2 family protein